MNLIELTAQSFRSPVVLFFLLGLIAGSVRSGLRFPASISQALGLYLVFAVGFKGGVELSRQPVGPGAALTVGIAIFLSFLIPFFIYAVSARVLTYLTKFDRATLGAYYGSVSLVTFIAATNFLDSQSVSYSGYFVILLTLMGTPAILSALFIKKKLGVDNSQSQFLADHFRQIAFTGSSFLLVGSFVVGFLSSGSGTVVMYGFLNVPFQGVLGFFLLNMGIIGGQQIASSKQYSRRLVFFGVFFPFLHGLVAIAFGTLLRLDLGDRLLLAILCASASFIVTPSAMRKAIPNADHGLAMTLSLGVTFPFNIIFGLPIFYWLAQWSMTL